MCIRDRHDISILVDRIVLNSSLGNRLAESVETSLNIANGLIIVEYENETLPKKYRKIEKLLFSSKFACPESGFTIEEIEPRLFSFNSPYGACEECEGIGVKLNVDPKLVVPNEKKSLEDLIKENEMIAGVVARDSIENKTYKIMTKGVINATGVFSDSITNLDIKKRKKTILVSIKRLGRYTIACSQLLSLRLLSETSL